MDTKPELIGGTATDSTLQRSSAHLKELKKVQTSLL